MQLVSYCSLSQPFRYINRTDGRSTKAVCGFHKLIQQSERSPITITHFCEYVN
jgi:hypothetical protein